jgi:hypothetical protein
LEYLLNFHQLKKVGEIMMLRGSIKAARSTGCLLQPAAFSTQVSQGDKLFVTQRSIYKDQLTSMRKKWQLEIDERNEAAARELAAAKEKMVLAKAIRLREKRKESVLRQAADKQRKELAAEHFVAHLAHNKTIYREREEQLGKWHNEMAKSYEEESKHWLTPENLETQITEDLFDTPSTTGIRFKDSEYWRYSVNTLKLKRFTAIQDQYSDMSGTSLADRVEYLAELRSNRKLIIQDFLDPMIGTGDERSKYQEILDNMTDNVFNDGSAFEDFEDMNTYHEDEINAGNYNMDAKGKYAVREKGEEYIEDEDDENFEFDEDDPWGFTEDDEELAAAAAEAPKKKQIQKGEKLGKQSRKNK